MTIEVAQEMIAATATIAAAGIAGAIAFLSLLISKEQAVSEFRQKWIDSLRDDLAEFLSAATSISVHAQINTMGEQTEIDAAKMIAPIESYISTAYRVYHRIILRLNPEEHEELRALVIQLERSLSRYDVVGEPKAFGDMCDDLSEKAHKALKKEWNRVKRGETIYFLVKIASGLCFIGLISWAIIYLFNSSAWSL